jgi:hypothetical protein
MANFARSEISKVAADLSSFLEPGQVTELRAVGCTRGRDSAPHVEGGVFRDNPDLMAKYALLLTEKSRGVYFTLNPLREALVDQKERFGVVRAASEGELAKNEDVTERHWIAVDCDRRENRKSPATGEERVRILQVAESVREFTRSLGWPDPTILDTGNGYQVLYRTRMPRDDNGTVYRAVLAIKRKCETGSVEIDLGPTKPLLMVRVPGTLNRKGRETEGRPYWRANVVIQSGR